MNEPITVRYSLEEILKRLEGKIDKIDEKIDKMDERIGHLEVGQARLEEKLSGEIKTLDEKLSGDIKSLDIKFTGEIKTLDIKVDGISKRLDNQEFLNRGVLIGLIVALLGGLAKMFGWIGSP